MRPQRHGEREQEAEARGGGAGRASPDNVHHSVEDVRTAVQRWVAAQTFTGAWSDHREETSLNATKELVRKKLGLGDHDVIELSQVRDGRVIDLEDGTDISAVCGASNLSVIQMTTSTLFVYTQTSRKLQRSKCSSPALHLRRRFPCPECVSCVSLPKYVLNE